MVVMTPSLDVSVQKQWVHQSLDATQKSMKTIQWIQIKEQTNHGDFAPIPAMESHHHLPVRITWPSQNIKHFGNHLCMILVPTQMATVTHMTRLGNPTLICLKEYSS